MKNRHQFLAILVCIICFMLISLPACKKKEKEVEETVPEQKLPELITSSANNLSQTKVDCGGNIANEGSSSVTARGICWSQHAKPTIDDKKIAAGTGTGTFTNQIRALVANTKYYVRAYATNSFGTSYGNEISFTTQKDADGTVTDADGNVYHIVKIGNQEWLKENLKTLTYLNGDTIKPWGDEKIGGYCYLANTMTTAAVFGVMYNWYAVNDSRKIAPPGWHIPSDTEWQQLIAYAGGGDVGGGKLKEVGIEHWNSPNEGATDDYGFSARGGGYRVETGGFMQVGYVSFFWSASDLGGNAANSVYLRNNVKEISIDFFYKRSGLYVRCIKD